MALFLALICSISGHTPKSGGLRWGPPQVKEEGTVGEKIKGENIAHKRAGEIAGPREKQGLQSWFVPENWFWTKRDSALTCGHQRHRQPR